MTQKNNNQTSNNEQQQIPNNLTEGFQIFNNKCLLRDLAKLYSAELERRKNKKSEDDHIKNNEEDGLTNDNESTAQLKRYKWDLDWVSDENRNVIGCLCNCFQSGDRLYTFSVYDIMYNVVNILYKKQYKQFKNYNKQFDIHRELDLSENYRENLHTAILNLYDYLFKHKFNLNNINIDEIRKSINKEYLHKLDGMDVLISHFKSDNEYIEMAVEGSYFFEANLVKSVMEELEKEVKKSRFLGDKLSNMSNQELKSFLKEPVNEALKDNTKMLIQNFINWIVKGTDIQNILKALSKKQIKNYISEKHIKEPINEKELNNIIKSIRESLKSKLNQKEQFSNEELQNMLNEEVNAAFSVSGNVKKFICAQIDNIIDNSKNHIKDVNKLVNSLTKTNLADSLGKKTAECSEEIKILNKAINNLTSQLKYLKARYTTDERIIGKRNRVNKGDKAIYIIGGESYRVHIDIDGNRFVRNLINDKTGVVVSQGKGSLLQNTIISHVWGNAYDPRYFTSLWNIVLIPAWANSLMDKDDAPANTLASKMRATYMKICTEYYQMSNNPLIEIKNNDDVVSGKYTFNVLEELKDKDNDIIIISKGCQKIP